MASVAGIDQNSKPTLTALSSANDGAIVPLWADPTTHRLLVDLPSSGTVTSVSVVSANGFAGTVATPTTTPAITLSTTITGIVKGNGTAISTATAGTDYIVGGTATVGNLIFVDNLYDIGASAATRPRNIYTSGGIAVNSNTATAGVVNVGTGFRIENAASVGKIMRADGTNFIASTATYPDNATTTGNVLMADGTNWVSTAPTSTATASTLLLRDANANAFANNFVGNFTTTATAAGTTTLTAGSSLTQVFTGATTQTVTLPVASTLTQGHQFYIVNLSTGAVTVNSSGANAVIVVPSLTTVLITCILNSGTTAASWLADPNSIIPGSGKSLRFNNSLTLAGTDATTMTFPSTSASVARTDAAQTFTGTQTFSQVITTNNAIAASGNAATVPITSRISTVTNNSAATLTITITTASAVDGQMVMVRILDFSAVAQTITWVNTENSTVTAPTTSNGSTTLPLTVGFQFNSATTKWRCLFSA